MTLRSFALVLAVLWAATPVVGIVCEIDCGQPPMTSSACHKSTVSADAPTLRGARHACDHDHSAGSPALLKSAGGRDAAGASVSVPLPSVAHAWTVEPRGAAALAIHGPPGLTGCRTSSRNTVLRI